jgi:carboxyl-terminal processing protease
MLLRGVEKAAPAGSSPASDNHTASENTLKPGADDGRIAFVAAKLLEGMHYSRQEFNDDVSRQFLDRYLETLDPQHVHFLQSDLAEFETYRTTLDNLTLGRRGKADTAPAYDIFSRFMQRLEERTAYAQNLLKNEKFEFNTDERIVANRRESPYPKDLAEAKQLWSERLRFEYLQEKLGRTGTKKKTDAAKATKNLDSEITELLSRRYQRNLRTFKEWSSDEVLEIYLTSLAHIYDPHSDYLGKQQLENFAIGMNLELFGIGAELSSPDGYCTINKLVEGGPAAQSKQLKVKDRIVAVAQGDQPPVDVVDMALNKVVQMIRGKKGTEVRLTVMPADSDEHKIVTLIRDRIKLEEQAAKAKIIDLPGKDGTVRVGVIDLPSFYAPFDVGQKKMELANQEGSGPAKGASEIHSTSADVTKLINKLKEEKVGGIILDLRHNGGGSLEEAIKLTGLFIKEGPIVQVRAFDGSVQVDTDSDPAVVYDGPLVVLTSRFSASASEIVAGALQDYGRALIVGDSSTHGKGTVQNVNDLRTFMRPGDLTTGNNPGALKLTIRKFYRASGASTQWKGVMPDIVMPSVLNYWKDVGERSLDNSLPWDTIKSADYEKVNRVAPYLSELLKRSTARIATNQDFTYIREDIEIFKKQQEDKTVSLNEQERIKEKEEAEAREKARKQERFARKDTEEKTYEITLKLADQPGLPAPVVKTNSLIARASQGGGAVSASKDSVSLAATAPAQDPNVNAEEQEEKAPTVDATLNEAEQIMIDYVSLLAKARFAASKN